MDKYWVINRVSDFTRGLMVGMRSEGEGLTLEKAEGIARGCVYLPCADAGQRDFAWTRLTVDVEPFDGFVRISAFAADNDVLPEEGQRVDDYLRDPYVARSVKQGVLDPLYTRTFAGGRDVLLSLRGQYLYLKVELIVMGGALPVLRAVRARLSGDHMLDYLPAVYAQRDRDGFLYRYLSLFDSMIKDLEERIDHFDEQLDFDKQSGDALRYLAAWVGVEEADADDASLRRVLRTAVADNERAQTPEGIKKRVEHWTGARPILVEHFLVEPMQTRGGNTQLYIRLFGTQENCFHILLPEKCFASQQAAQDFLRRLEDILPANVRAELVLLRESVYLDRHTYLGVNSVISGRTGAAIDRKVAIEYDTVIGGELN